MNSTQQNFNACREAPLSHCRKLVFAVLSLAIILFAVYSNSFDCAWQFDDKNNILERKSMHLTELTWQNIKNTFLNEKGIPYRPLSYFSFAINYYFGKDAVGGYHLVNTFIHLLASVFLFLFIYQALGLPVFKARWMPYRYSIALVAALLWSLNPIQTQAVTYIVQRMASLAGMFYILCMYLYLKARTSSETRPRTVFFFLSAAAALLAMSTKENAFMLPVSIYALEMILLRNPSDPRAMKRFKIATIVLAVVLCLSFLLLFFTRGTPSILAGYEGRTFTLAERILTQPRVILFYVSLIFYPAPTRLSLEHYIPLSTNLLAPPTTLLSLALIAVLISGALYYSRTFPFLSFTVLFFFINHLVESSFVPLEMVFEHRNYIPSMFLFVPLAMLLCYGVYEARLKKSIKAMICLFIPCIIIAFGHGTFVRNFVWKTEESLWMNATEMAPENWRPWHNLGKYYALNHSYDLALSHFFEALTKQSHPNRNEKKITHYNIGYAFNALGEKEKALFHYLQAELLDPRFGPARNNKAVILDEKGQRDDAIKELREALRTTPKLRAAHINLGRILLLEGMVDEAVEYLEKALQLDGTDTFALKELGNAYRQKGLLGKAYLAYSNALRFNPKDLAPLLYLAELYAFRDMEDRKKRTMERFIRLIPETDLMKLIKSLRDPDAPQGAFSIDRSAILTLLSEALHRKGSEILDKAGYLKQ